MGRKTQLGWPDSGRLKAYGTGLPSPCPPACCRQTNPCFNRRCRKVRAGRRTASRVRTRPGICVGEPGTPALVEVKLILPGTRCPSRSMRKTSFWNEVWAHELRSPSGSVNLCFAGTACRRIYRPNGCNPSTGESARRMTTNRTRHWKRKRIEERFRLASCSAISSP